MAETTAPLKKPVKLHGRAFYESIGAPKVVLAPMVEQSEFAWRMLSRSFFPPDQRKSLLAYTPMFHSRMFADTPKYRDSHFQPLKSGTMPTPPGLYHTTEPTDEEWHLDGNPSFDRPLFVQFCSNSPDGFLNAAEYVSPFCDAVDLNLGCPQGIAKRGHYGSFLQEDWDLISSLIQKLHAELDVPVTAKMRVLETKEKTLEYAKMILDAGASIITVHGRRREQKGHNTGLADWSFIRYLRDNLPKETVIFANGNILQHEDIERCLQETGADAVMSAEGNLYDPAIFAPPPKEGEENGEYWRGRDGKGGYRVDAVMRRYLDIIYKYTLGIEPPQRKPLWHPSDPATPAPAPAPETASDADDHPHKRPREENGAGADDQQPPTKRQKQSKAERRERQQKITNPNLTAMQAHLFHLLRPLVSEHHNVRDALARCRVGEMESFETVLALTEEVVKNGILGYAAQGSESSSCTGGRDSDSNGVMQQEGNRNAELELVEARNPAEFDADPYTSSLATVKRCKRPWWVAQPYVRPLPNEALEKGSMQLSKKEKARLEREKAEKVMKEKVVKEKESDERAVGLRPGGKIGLEIVGEGDDAGGKENGDGNGVKKDGKDGEEEEVVEVPKEGVVCG